MGQLISPPSTAEDLLFSLRTARLLSARRAEMLSRRWSTRCRSDSCAEYVRELVAASILTQYQADQVLAGRAQRLRLGAYRVLERLGSGGMSQVYKAEHILMQRTVALKIIARLPRCEKAIDSTPENGKSAVCAEMISRFRREVRAASQLCHPNIVMAYDAGVARGFLFLVMEYIEGIDLGRFVAANGPLPVPLACEAVRQAALALQYAHDRGIVHRDIKPSNLLLTWPGADTPHSVGSLPSLPDGSYGEGTALIKLLDLGLALPTCIAPERAEPAGTPDYMAPEQARGHEAIDARSDLYSLGCTLYYLLTGRVPYPGGSWTEKLLRHGLELPCAVNTLRPEIPATVAAIVERLMAKKAEQRYPDPATVAAVLWKQAENGWGEQKQRTTFVGETDVSPPSTPSLPELPVLSPAPEPMLVSTVTRRLPAPAAIVAAAFTGLFFALTVRWLPSPATRAEEEDVTPVSLTASPFRVERLGRDFDTLTDAVAAAADGDVLTVHGPGRHRIPPTDLGAKALTLRATPGNRVQLESNTPDDDGPWQALLATTHPLTLEGLDLVTSGDAPLIAGSNATLQLTDCHLTATGSAPIVVARGGQLRLRSCNIQASTTALAVEMNDSPCMVSLIGNAITVSEPMGVAVAMRAPEISRPADIALYLEQNSVEASRVASFHALPGKLCVEANNNELTFREALLSFTGYAGDSAWRRSTTWKGRDNRFHAPGSWLRIDGQPLTVNDLNAWQRLWIKQPETGPHQTASVQSAGLR